MKRIKIKSFADVKKIAGKLNILDLAEFFIKYESTNEETSREKVIEKMRTAMEVMRSSVESGLKKKNITGSEMIKGGAYKMSRFIENGRSLISPEFSEIIRNTLAVSEANACMKKIVAAPTAGASGVIPGTIFKIADKHKISDDELIRYAMEARNYSYSPYSHYNVGAAVLTDSGVV